MAAHPIQAIVDDCGVKRFKQNKIVRFLADSGGLDMNQLARMSFPQEDWEQFYQLIGYSLSGFEELSRVSDEAVERVKSIQDATPTVPPRHENCRCVLDFPAMSTVEWHFDGPPTKGQVPDGASCLVSRRGNTTLSVTCGSVARNWWNNGHIKHSPYAWAYLPKVPPEPKPYEPPTTWQDPNNRPPTEADADEFGKVAVVYIDGEFTSSSWEWVRDKPSLYRKWIPTKRLADALQEGAE